MAENLKDVSGMMEISDEAWSDLSFEEAHISAYDIAAINKSATQVASDTFGLNVDSHYRDWREKIATEAFLVKKAGRED